MFEGFVGVVLGSIITTIFQYLSFIKENKYKYSNLYASTISKQRIKTVNDIRNNTCEILAILKSLYFNKNAKQNIYKEIKKLQKAISKIKTLLSIYPNKDGNEFHFELENELKNLEDEKTLMKLLNDIDTISLKKCTANIEKYSRLIFDYEWKRVKREANGEFNET